MLDESTLSTLGTFYFTGFLSHFSCFEKWARDLQISWNNLFKTLFRLSWSSWLSRVCASSTRAREIWSVGCLIQAYRTRALLFRANGLLACENSQLFPQAAVRANPLGHVLHWLLSLRNTMMQSTSYVSRRKSEILSPRVLIIYAWIIAVNVFHQFFTISVLVTVPWIVQRSKHWFYLEKPLPNKTAFFISLV